MKLKLLENMLNDIYNNSCCYDQMGNEIKEITKIYQTMYLTAFSSNIIDCWNELSKHCEDIKPIKYIDGYNYIYDKSKKGFIPTDKDYTKEWGN